MKLNSREIVELISVFAVIASLLFVGLQLQLDRNVALADQYFYRSESIKSDLRAQLESEANMTQQENAWNQGARPNWWNEELETYIEELGMTGKDVHSGILRTQLNFFHIDSLYFQYQNGFLEEEMWESFRNEYLKSTLSQSVSITKAYYIWNALGDRIERPLDSVLRELITENENETQN